MPKLNGFDLHDMKSLRLPALAMPKWGAGNGSAALVLYPQEVQLAWMNGAAIAGQVRASINGSDVNALIQAIREVWAAAKLKSPRVAVSIASTDILVRFFKIPPIPSDERDSAVPLEARKYIPFKVDELAWDYAVSSDEAAHEELKSLEVVFSAIPGEILGRFQSALASAGLQAASIEPLSQSLARFTANSNAKSKAAQLFECFVQIRRDSAHIVIAQRGIPYMVRDVQSAATAPGQAPEGGATLVQRLVSELSVSMDFFKREYASAVFDRVSLCAEEDTVALYARELSGLLPYPVESLAKAFTETERGIPLAYGAALGVLRAHAAKGARRSLNFLQHVPSAVAAEAVVRKSSHAPNTEDVVETLKSPPALASAAATAVLLSAALWAAGNMQISQTQQQVEAVKQSRAASASALDALGAKELKPIQDQAKEQLNLIKGLVDQQPRLAEKLDALPRILPSGVWLTTLTFENKIVISKSAKQKPQALLSIAGACYLGASDKELRAIQDFEARVKNNATLQKGLPAAQLGKITGSIASGGSKEGQSVLYKQFQLSCQSNKSGKI